MDKASGGATQPDRSLISRNKEDGPLVNVLGLGGGKMDLYAGSIFHKYSSNRDARGSRAKCGENKQDKRTAIHQENRLDSLDPETFVCKADLRVPFLSPIRLSFLCVRYQNRWFTIHRGRLT